MVSLSRVIVAAHWLSDVLGSIALAFVALNAIRFKVFKTFCSKVGLQNLPHSFSLAQHGLILFQQDQFIDMNIDLLFSEWVSQSSIFKRCC
ncbi:MAG: hypothetical protein CM15mP31_4420 [Gammaproteobacteria bacterium]|nr:MAG: hypothetical protein CM15mP31_4420 [Gammaproteobacteria bacterium]